MSTYLAVYAILATGLALKFYYQVSQLRNTVDNLERRSARYLSLLEKASKRKREAYGLIFHVLDSTGQGYITPEAAQVAARRAGAKDTNAITRFFDSSVTQVHKQEFIEYMLTAQPDDMTDEEIQNLLDKFGVISFSSSRDIDIMSMSSI